MNTDSDRDFASTWFRAPLSLVETEACCSVCNRAISPGEIIADDAEFEYIHESCAHEEDSNAD